MNKKECYLYAKNWKVLDDINYEEYCLDRKIKVAICFYGHIRNNFSATEFIDKMKRKYEVDIFFHSWNEVGLQKEVSFGPEPSRVDNSNLLREFVKKNRISSFAAEDNFFHNIKIPKKNKIILSIWEREKKNGFVFAQAKPEYILSQLYSVKKSFDLMNEYSLKNSKKYDIIFKSRFDYFYNSIPSHNEMSFSVLNKNALFCPNIKYSNHGHPTCYSCYENIKNKSFIGCEVHDTDICDVFSFGNLQVMSKYMKIFDRIDEIVEYDYKKNIINMKEKNIVLKKINKFNCVNQLRDHDYYEINCFYPERIFKNNLKNILICPSSVSGKIIR